MTFSILHAHRKRPADPRLGRHFSWDSRNEAYLFQGTPAYTSVRWTRNTPILDQGNLGSCTGNAIDAILGCSQLYAALSPEQQAAIGSEGQAVAFYSLATQLDGYPGTYPPDDTGSDGPSAAKAAMQLGYLSGYQHATTISAAMAALEQGPVITGVNWYNNMFSPDANGLVTIPKHDTVAGGHEFLVDEIDAVRGWVGCDNSWGTSFGVGGRFYMTFATWQRLLGEQGDVTVPVPLSAPAPVPVPVPVPTAVTGQQAADAVTAALRNLGLTA
jgi:hypothetical protein